MTILSYILAFMVAIGILLPLAWVQARWPEWGLTSVLTGTVVGVIFAYLVLIMVFKPQGLLGEQTREAG